MKHLYNKAAAYIINTVNTYTINHCLVTVVCNVSAEQFCKDPGVPEHGGRTPSSGVFFENAVARFSCLEGYRLKGASKITCVLFHNGSMGWRPSLKPVCLPDGE